MRCLDNKLIWSVFGASLKFQDFFIILQKISMDTKSFIDESVLANQINGGRNVSLSLLEAYRGIAADLGKIMFSSFCRSVLGNKLDHLKADVSCKFLARLVVSSYCQRVGSNCIVEDGDNLQLIWVLKGAD